MLEIEIIVASATGAVLGTVIGRYVFWVLIGRRR